MELVKKNHIGKQRGELDLIQKQKLVQKASVEGVPSCVSQSRETESRMRDPEKVLDQDKDSDLVQRRASSWIVESASLEGAPSSVNQSRETEPRMRDPEKVLDQAEDSDLVQRRASPETVESASL